MSRWLPGRDRRAVRHAAAPGAARLAEPKRVVVVGGGIAGLAAAAVLAERGAAVTLVERHQELGGRVRAWPVGDGRTMSRGFHAFFRQYYNLRQVLRRADPSLARLVPVSDYPLQRPDGVRDSFARLPRTPPWSIAGFVATSPTFTLSGLAGVDVRAALELLRVSFPRTFSDYDGESAAAFLDRLRFPAAARDLALEVFARSFFADPREFSAGELVAMFHTYFLGSAEGLLFDVPDDDYESALWAPLRAYLERVGVQMRTGTEIDGISLDPLAVHTAGSAAGEGFDAIVLAVDPRTARRLIADLDGADPAWASAVARTRSAPPFAVLRLWFDGRVRADRPAFLGTSGYGPLDNVSVLERFERGAGAWSGSVVELHAYAAPAAVTTDARARQDLRDRLIDELRRVYPETADLGIRAEEFLVADDCTLIDPSRWNDRPSVSTPHPGLVLAGDWVRCDYPVALMERAATTGILAANEVLATWGVAGEDVWTVPLRGLLGRRPG